MKNRILRLSALVLALSLTLALAVSCGQPCTHTDGDSNNVCDLCGEALASEPCVHVNGDGDSLCDLCGENIMAEPCSHTDSNDDSICDLCGEELGGGAATPTKEELLAAADAALTNGHYKITAGFTAECDNPDYSDDISALFEGSAVEILVQGNNIAVSTPANMSFMNIRIIGNVAYVRYLNYELLESLRVKAALDADQREELWDMLPTEPRLSVTDFAEATVSPEGDKLICTELYPSVYDEVYADMDISGAVDGISNVSFADVSMTVTFSDGKYDSLIIDYSLTCNIDGEAANIVIRATMTYSYENLDYIISPEDASQYSLVEFDSLMSLFG